MKNNALKQDMLVDGIINNGQSCRSESRSDLPIQQNISSLRGAFSDEAIQEENPAIPNPFAGLPRRSAAPRNDRPKAAFSLIELLISLIAISCIIAAFAPVISKKISTGQLGDARISTQCKKFETNLPDGTKSKCKLCLSDRCLLCGAGTRPDVQGVCQLRAYEPTYVADINGLKVMQRNIGDDPTIDRTMLEKLGVKVVHTGESCNSSEEHPCCWIGETANQSDCDSKNSNYSGCHRTVCDWWASNKVCKKIGWRLPYLFEINHFRVNQNETSQLFSFLKKGKMNIDLCSHHADGNTNCNVILETNCLTKYNHNCHAPYLYAAEEDNKIAWIWIYNNSIESSEFHGDSTPYYSALSARCVSGHYNKCVKNHGLLCTQCTDVVDENGEVQSKGTCTACMDGYVIEESEDAQGNKTTKCVVEPIKVGYSTNIGGLEVMTRNIGDDPVVNKKKLEELGVTVVKTGESCSSNANHPCCFVDYTSINTSKSNVNNNYPATKRTGCDWWAANRVCEGIGWRLPTKEEIYSFRPDSKTDSPILWFLRGNSRKSLDLCQYHDDGYHPYCARIGIALYLDHLWGVIDESGKIYTPYFRNGGFIHDWYEPINGYRSVRCVRGELEECARLHGASCLECTAGQCTKCVDGYTLNKEGKCVRYIPKNPTYTTNFNGLDIMQRNIGDDPTVDRKLLEQLGITVVNAGEYCSSSENTPCCWVATETKNTAGECDNVNSPSYSGCKRTACDWWASNRVCEGIGWRLPKKSEIQLWRTTPEANSSVISSLKYNGTNNIFLCAEASGYSFAKCYIKDSSCLGAVNSRCYMDNFWSSTAYDSSSHYDPGLSGSQLYDSYDPGNVAVSTRCVHGEYNTCFTSFGDACTACTTGSGAKCTQCRSGYSIGTATANPACVKDPKDPQYFVNIQGLKVMTRNIGDDPIINVQFLKDAGVTVVKTGQSCNNSESNPCCWIGDTAVQSTCTNNGDYPGCHRTVCDWYAGDKVCKAMGGDWRLPSFVDEISMWRKTYSTTYSAYPLLDYLNIYGSNPLNLCGMIPASGIVCDETYGQGAKCIDNWNNHGCYPDYLHIAEQKYFDYTENLRFKNSSGTLYPASVRCVSGDYNACTKKHGILCQQCNNDNSKCLLCVDGAHMSANTANPYNGGTGLCVMPTVAESSTSITYTDTSVTPSVERSLQIMRYNVGDSPLLTKKMLREAGIHLVEAGQTSDTCNDSINEPCCWIATGTENTGKICDGTKAEYDGCKRTVCNKTASLLACAKIGWDVPNEVQLQGINSLPPEKLLGTGSTDVQHCDWHGWNISGTPYASCDHGNSICSHSLSLSAKCPSASKLIGAADASPFKFIESIGGHYYILNSDGSSEKEYDGYSVRCVK